MIPPIKILRSSTSHLQLKRNNPTDAGMDIVSSEDVYLSYHGGSVVVHTDLYIEIPEGYVGIVKSRSGLSVKECIEVGAGVIDSDYRGEVMIKLYNFSTKYSSYSFYKIPKHSRIAQLLILPVELCTSVEVDSLSSTDRGEKGIGSSGL